jgi:hypothetical protein
MCEDGKLMSIDELIDYLPDKPTKGTIYVWTCNNKIPYIKKGKKLFFVKEKIDIWDANRTTSS